MSGNTFGQLFAVTNFGESHGPAIGCVIDGCPPGLELSEANRRQVWIPPGFAHGCLALGEADVLYKTTDYYAPEHERCIAWNDPDLAIAWPLAGAPVLSAKDARGTLLSQADTFVSSLRRM